MRNKMRNYVCNVRHCHKSNGHNSVISPNNYHLSIMLQVRLGTSTSNSKESNPRKRAGCGSGESASAGADPVWGREISQWYVPSRGLLKEGKL
jgi:hypothetical protein